MVYFYTVRRRKNFTFEAFGDLKRKARDQESKRFFLLEV